VLFTDEFYENSARILTGGGLIVNQCGVPFMQAEELHDTSLRRRQFFPHVGAYIAAVPTYVGGYMTLGWASKQPGIASVDVATIQARAKAAGILGRTRYWSPEVHAAAFHLPPYIAEHLPT
jgi:spermidine synthase